MFPRFKKGFNEEFSQKMSRNFHNKFRQPLLPEAEQKAWQQFQDWYTTDLGLEFRRTEKQVLDSYLPDMFGYFLLQSGCPEVKAAEEYGNWIKSSRVLCKICLDQLENKYLSCQANPAQLPMMSTSLDIVVLPHVLEFSCSPHQVLREVERVLIAEGYVVILGFNPLSIWNLFRKALFWKKETPWNGHFLATSRVMDWLALLEFDVVQRQGYFYRPPLQNENLMRKMGIFEKIGQRVWPNFGAGYILVARKRVVTLTPIRPRWHSKRQVIVRGFETTNRTKV